MMSKKLIYSSVFSVFCLLGAESVTASSLPAIDSESTSIGGGLISPGLSVDFPVAPNIYTGASLALPIYYPSDNFGTVRYDLHIMYQMIKEKNSKLSFGAIAGLWGDRNFFNQDFDDLIIALQIGFGISYKINDLFLGRLNIVAGLPASKYGIIPPAAGFEFVYTPNSNLELSLGLNGQGEIIGFRWKF